MLLPACFMLHRQSFSGLVHMCNGCYAHADRPGWWSDERDEQRLFTGTKVREIVPRCTEVALFFLLAIIHKSRK